MALFVIKLWLIYRNPTAVLDQRRQSRDTLGHPAGNGQDEIPQTRYGVQARPDRLGQPEDAARKRQRNRAIQPCGRAIAAPHEGEGVLGALQPMRAFTTDHVKTLGLRKPDRRRSDCPDLMLFCSGRIPEAILNSARNQRAVHTMTIGLEPFAIQLAPVIKPTRLPLGCHGCLHRF